MPTAVEMAEATVEAVAEATDHCPSPRPESAEVDSVGLSADPKQQLTEGNP